MFKMERTEEIESHATKTNARNHERLSMGLRTKRGRSIPRLPNSEECSTAIERDARTPVPHANVGNSRLRDQADERGTGKGGPIEE